MKQTLIRTIVVLCLTKNIIIAGTNDMEDIPEIIESKNYDFFKAKSEITEKCELDEMYAYTLRGDA